MRDMTRQTVSVEEAARILGLGRSSAYEAVRRGDIPSLRIGRRILVPRAALERLLGEETRSTVDPRQVSTEQ